MFFNRKKKEEKPLEAAPLYYWEERSCMMALSKDISASLTDGIFERVAAIEGVTVKAKNVQDKESPGRIVLDYDGEEYQVTFFEGPFQWSPMLGINKFRFSEEELEGFQKADRALNVGMDFHADCKKSYHLQIKLIVAMVPDLLGIVDESAENMISAKWAVMAAESKVTPGPSSLYVVQAVSDDDEVWLHTHGLCRCGLTELEILESDRENYNTHYHLLSTFASYLMDQTEEFVPRASSAYIGMLADQSPVVATYVPWTEGLQEYKKRKLGGAEDRTDSHNSRTSLVFLYASDADENIGKLTKVTEYNSKMGDNPLFFISNEETDRMRRLARERFHFVRENASKPGNMALIKIGLVRDDREPDSDEREHIWFELIGFDGESFRAKLTQEPYAVASMHEGDEAVFTVEDVTDWILYTPEFSVSPDSAYLLM